MKRILLFVGTNVAIMVVLGIVSTLTGAHKPRNATETWLSDTVTRLAERAELPTPEVANGRPGGMALFSSHPPIEQRIEALTQPQHAG